MTERKLTTAELISRFTPEQHRILNQQIQEHWDAILIGQPWVREYLEQPAPMSPEGLQWVRSRPQEIKNLLVRFPPGCLVKPKPSVRLLVPAPGTYGLLYSYFESGSVSVRQSPTSSVKAECNPDDLELAACREGFFPQDIRVMLGLV